jgi:1-hydroxycarotenoid 3,4-desaturase
MSGRVAIVGAGIGGLAAALMLAVNGVDVTVVEKLAAPGGKLRQIVLDGAAIDAGPTVFTMRWVFEELFAAAGTSLADHLTLRPASILARHAWDGGGRLDLFADIDRSAEAIGDFAGAEEARGYRAFCDRARLIYRTLEGPFLRAARPTPLSLVAGAGTGIGRISPFTTLWRALGEHFRDPRLRQLFGRYATYCGASPYRAPATLMLVAHVEQDGVWMVEGGMHRIAAATAALAARHGARFRQADVAEVLVAGGRATGLRLADGERIAADAVLVNGDAGAVGAGLFGRAAARAAAAVAPGDRSLSAVTWAVHAPAAGFPLVRHNVFFSSDYAAEFADIERGRLPAAPTVYVCAQDRDDAGLAGDGAERLFLIVNAPPLGDARPFPPEEIARCATTSFGLLQRCGLTVDRAAGQEQATTPADFHRMFPGTGGALYGPASHGWTASFRRPGARTRVPGLYLAGGSTHPGPGVPMAALSGRLAAASLLEDLASTRRSPRAAMSGGTSTR